MGAITIDELYKDLAKLRKQGLGGKKILISQDDEGNGYHELFFGVTTDIEGFEFDKSPYMLPWGVSPEEAERDYVILG